jgi:hypothetical protein
MPSRKNPNPNPKLAAAGLIASMIMKHGEGSPEVAAARTALQVVRAEIELRKLLDAAPTSEQIERLRSLLPAVR